MADTTDGCTAPAGPGRPDRHRLFSGWGRTAPTAADVAEPADPDEVVALVRDAPGRGTIPRGLGRSYGDAAQNAGGRVLRSDRLDRVLDVDLPAGRARVGAGVSLHRLMRLLVPLGYFPMVTPGTRQVTVGGAIAADIHGKNHHVEGSFTNHVEALDIATPARGLVRATPAVEADVFWATAGGMGLTGMIVEATLRLLPIETSLVAVDTERVGDLDALLARMVESDDRYRYSVAWLDSLARGARLGRAVLTRGDHAALDALPAADRGPARRLAFAPDERLRAPAWAPPGLVNRWTVAAFNEAWFRKAPRHEAGRLQTISAFFHPLDGVADWNRIYGRAGFVQYQVLVPDGAEDVLRTVIERLSDGRCASVVTVLKRFGPGNPSPLSFPRPGWTLAVDIPTPTHHLAELLDQLDVLVAGAGGRVYLAKDARLRPELLPVMYPELARWQKVRDELDPDHHLQSDLSRRLWTLTGERPSP